MQQGFAGDMVTGSGGDGSGYRRCRLWIWESGSQPWGNRSVDMGQR